MALVRRREHSLLILTEVSDRGFGASCHLQSLRVRLGCGLLLPSGHYLAHALQFVKVHTYGVDVPFHFDQVRGVTVPRYYRI
jgi:hypothetical protein